MFRHHSSGGPGPGKGPGLSHSCWMYQRGIVQKRGLEPEARAQGSQIPSNQLLPTLPSLSLLPSLTSPLSNLLSQKPGLFVRRRQGRA